MIHYKQNIGLVRFQGKIIGTIRYGATIIYQAIKSCFGKGYWLNNKPWSNKDNWRNSK